MSEQRPNAEAQPAAVRDHLANERTMLAWVRTAITIIGLGFLVGRFLVDGGEADALAIGLAAVLVLAGTASAAAGLARFVAVERQIDSGHYRPSIVTHVVLTATITIVGLLILVYLLVAPGAAATAI
jgi:putative membrane protein